MRQITIHKVLEIKVAGSTVAGFYCTVIAFVLMVVPITALAKIPNDPLFEQQWYLEHIGAPAAWDVATGSRDIVVAVLDTGVVRAHPDLQHALWVNQKEILGDAIDNDHNGYIDDANGWDFIDDDAIPEPVFVEGFLPEAMHHGTLVAGIIGAQGNNHRGITGVAWNVRIMPLRVLDSFGHGDSVRVRQAIEYAVANGADVINMSFIGIAEDPNLANAVQEAYNAGVVLVAAAGNGTENLEGNAVGLNLDQEALQPVCLDAMIGKNILVGVAATDKHDKKAVFSNFGESCVDISAPGVQFIGAQAKNLDAGEGFRNWYGGYWNGTSAATPVVTGALALAKSMRPDLPNDLLIKLLETTAKELPFAELETGEVHALGVGRIDLAAYVQAVQQVSAGSVLPSTSDKGVSISQKVSNIGILALDPISTFQAFSDSGEKKGESLLLKGRSVAYTTVTGGAQSNIIVGAAIGELPIVRAYNQDGVLVHSFAAYEKDMKGGIRVGVGDLNGNGRREIVTVPNAQSTPLVKIFSDSGQLVGQFLSYASGFHGGVSLAVGDVDGDGRDEIVTGAGIGGGPHVRVFNDRGEVQKQFFAYEKEFRNGIEVAVGNFSEGGRALVVAPQRGSPLMRVFTTEGQLRHEFLAYASGFHGGVSLAVGDIDGDGRDEIVAGAGKGGGPHVRIFQEDGMLKGQYFAYDAAFRGGIVVTIEK